MQNTKTRIKSLSRRSFVTKAWIAPTMTMVTLPVHAQMTMEQCEPSVSAVAILNAPNDFVRYNVLELDGCAISLEVDQISGTDIRIDVLSVLPGNSVEFAINNVQSGNAIGVISEGNSGPISSNGTFTLGSNTYSLTVSFNNEEDPRVPTDRSVTAITTLTLL